MKATESSLLDLLKGPRQFLIPIYQRSYSWSEEQCSQLWDDVLRVAEDDRYPAHFIGSVVYIEQGLYHATSIPQLLVIDGQQRLTTITLMIEALARALEKRSAEGETTPRKLRNYFLINAEEDGHLRYKLQLSRRDNATLRAIVEQKPLPEEPAPHLQDNFEWFEDQVAQAGVSPEVIYRGIGKLVVVDVSLSREFDNPQLIFESLNSTGLDLSQSDLIRNFILMGLEPAEQKELYEDHWLPIEKTLAGGRDDAFDRFLRAWLTLRLGEVPNLRRGYETFKRYRMLEPGQSIRDLVADLHECAEYYGNIALGREKHPALAQVFRGLQALRIDAPMPFLIHAYSLWKGGKLSEEDMVRVSRLMESWLFRRAVCDIPSNVLSRTFATLPKQLPEGGFLEALSANLMLRSDRQRFPRDEEFRKALTVRNLYEFKHRQYCLTRLENEGRKEPVDVGQYQIEHVIPQNEDLSPQWREMLGSDWRGVQERWLHTVGNLTLTGYNPELSDRPFVDKRDMAGGFRDSPLRLNRSLGKAEAWDEESIQARAEELSKKAVEIWPAPVVTEEVLQKYRKESKGRVRRPRTTLDHLNMSPTTRKLFDAFVDGAGELDLEPTIWKNWVGVGKPGAGKPYPVIIFPRRDWLLMQLFVPFGEVKSPPSIAYAHETRRGSLRTRVKVRALEDVDLCLQLVPMISALAIADLDDDADDSEGEADS